MGYAPSRPSSDEESQRASFYTAIFIEIHSPSQTVRKKKRVSFLSFLSKICCRHNPIRCGLAMVLASTQDCPKKSGDALMLGKKKNMHIVTFFSSTTVQAIFTQIHYHTHSLASFFWQHHFSICRSVYTFCKTCQSHFRRPNRACLL